MNHVASSAIAAAVLVALLFLGVAIAAPSPAGASSSVSSEIGPRWSELTTTQRELLAPVQREWSRMDERNKLKWIGVASRLANAGPAERERIQARMTEWATLTPQQRGQMRLRYEEARQEAPKRRQDRWAAYQALSPEEREKFAARGSVAKAASGASGASGTRWRRRSPSDAAVALRQPVAPAVVQAQPGATTSLMSRGLLPPPHLRFGLPRSLASPERVDSVTLLPRRMPGPTRQAHE